MTQTSALQIRRTKIEPPVIELVDILNGQPVTNMDRAILLADSLYPNGWAEIFNDRERLTYGQRQCIPVNSHEASSLDTTSSRKKRRLERANGAVAPAPPAATGLNPQWDDEPGPSTPSAPAHAVRRITAENSDKHHMQTYYGYQVVLDSSSFRIGAFPDAATAWKALLRDAGGMNGEITKIQMGTIKAASMQHALDAIRRNTLEYTIDASTFAVVDIEDLMEPQPEGN